MYTGIMIALVAFGVILLIWGYQASESIASGFSELFTGTPTDKAVWLLIAGVVVTIVGIAGLVSGRRRLN